LITPRICIVEILDFTYIILGDVYVHGVSVPDSNHSGLSLRYITLLNKICTPISFLRYIYIL